MKKEKSNFAVVIPAFNEQKRISKVLLEAKKYASLIIVVDDGSDDKTSEIARELGIKVLRHGANLGKGAALKTGCQAAFKMGVKTVITMDADGQHKPEDIPRFLKKLEEEKVDLVLGSRNLGFGMPLVKIIGNKLDSFLIAFLFSIYVTDPLCGFRAFTKKIYGKLAWKSLGYAVETEMVTRAGLAHLSFVEIPIETLYFDKGKGVSVFDAFKVLIDVLKWRFFKKHG